MAMEQDKKTTVEASPEKGEGQDASQLDPCQREQLAAELAGCKPGASGLTLRSASSKC
jgi:hypothetical protein